MPRSFWWMLAQPWLGLTRITSTIPARAVDQHTRFCWLITSLLSSIFVMCITCPHVDSDFLPCPLRFVTLERFRFARLQSFSECFCRLNAPNKLVNGGATCRFDESLSY